MAMILLVDDDQDILTFGKKILSSVGHDVMVAHTALEACDLLNRNDYDLVISDANMPQHSGFDLVKTLRADPRLKNIPITMLTARRDRKDVEDAVRLGVDDYIVKPIDPTLLVRKIDSIFQKHPPSVRATLEMQEVSLQSKATICLDAEVLSVSEIGMVISTSQALFEGQTLKLDTPLFAEMEIQAPLLKVLSCENQRTLKTWTARLLFVGTTDATLQKIRAWINQQVIQRRAKAAA